jgi:RNA polymerase sigma-70 factor (TIGR02960 family)
VTPELVDRARSGDEAAFEQLIAPHRREMQLHCYRILGSVADAEDALQETWLAAWRGLDGFEGRASLRTWLYRIATSRCLNMRRSSNRRPPAERPVLDFEMPEPTSLGEVAWLEPYPDVQLADLLDTDLGPDARYDAREAVSLAFVIAFQLLPPRQRAVLILRDVLDFSAREVADMLDVTEQSVTSALKRARATLVRELPATEPPPAPDSPAERRLLSQLVQAFEANDVDGMVALMTEDVRLRMPPLPQEYQGRDLAGRFFATVAFRQGHRERLVPTRANGQPAFGAYLRDEHAGVARANGLLVITIAGSHISAITRFGAGLMPRFGLPRTLAD